MEDHLGVHARVYAETVVPAATAEQHPWLLELGGDPLGETLQQRPDVSRGEFEFALLGPAQLPEHLARLGIADQPLWARRSQFSIDAAPLVVTEIFLPGIAASEKQRIHVAD